MKQEEKRFNIRVYGIWINEKQEVLLSKEEKGDWKFTKFPGGGLEWGEGLKEGLHREFKEETGLDLKVGEHIYTTDFFQQSAFRENDQLISIYFRMENPNELSLQNNMLAKDAIEGEMNRFIWIPLNKIKKKDLTFPIDQYIWQNYLQKIRLDK